MADINASSTEANRRIIRQAFEAWHRGTGAITDVFAAEMAVGENRCGRHHNHVHQALCTARARSRRSIQPSRWLSDMNATIRRVSFLSAASTTSVS